MSRVFFLFCNNKGETDGKAITYLMKVNCSPYMLGSRVRLGYFPNGGTIKLNTRAIHTKTAGRTI